MKVIFLNDTATTEIYTLSLHDALPISLDDLLLRERRDVDADVLELGHHVLARGQPDHACAHEVAEGEVALHRGRQDRKSTRLNSSHANISYAVFCLKKKKAPG